MEPLYSPQSRAERLIAGGRVVLAVSSLFAVWLDPSEPAKYAGIAYSLLVSYVVYRPADRGTGLALRRAVEPPAAGHPLLRPRLLLALHLLHRRPGEPVHGLLRLLSRLRHPALAVAGDAVDGGGLAGGLPGGGALFHGGGGRSRPFRSIR